MTPPDICLVVVTYQTKDLLHRCLSTVREEFDRIPGHHRMVVVDNASTDGTDMMVAKDFPDAIYIRRPENAGPARAFNQALTEALGLGSRYILISNSDIGVCRNTIVSLYGYMEGNPDTDGATGQLLNEDLTPQHQRFGALVDLFKRNTGKLQRLDWIGTGFGLLRSRVYRDLGGFDENFYFFNEDLDWVLRAKRKGLRFVYLPDAPVIHKLHGSSSQNQSRIVKELYKSNVYLYKKYFPYLLPLVVQAMKMEISGRIRALGKTRSPAGPTGQVDNAMKDSIINDYEEARKLMLAEVSLTRKPLIPDFPERVGVDG